VVERLNVYVGWRRAVWDDGSGML